MRAHIITDGKVSNTIVVDSLDIIPGLIDAENGGVIGDLWDGQTFTKPPIDPAKLQADITTATQARLDTFAKTRNYDGILSAATYATSTIQKFAAEGQYALTARDNTWATLYTILGEVQAGTRPFPTGFADVEPLLPALVWPV